MAFNKHEDGYAAVWKGKTEKAPTPGEELGKWGRRAQSAGLCPASFPSSPGRPWWAGPLEVSATCKPVLLVLLDHREKLPLLSYRPVFSLSMSSANLEGLDREKPHSSSVTSDPKLTFKQFLR